jgi:CHAT domain-containing protein
VGGEGLISLTRAFLYAGSRTVLSTLWSVSDESTAELMGEFYRRLAAGENKPAALRGAQRDFIAARVAPVTRSQTAHPFYWAGFILSGQP